MREVRWAIVLLGLLLAGCGQDGEERERPPDAPMMQPGNPASEGNDAPVAPGDAAGDTR